MEGHITPVESAHAAPGGVFRPEVEPEGGARQVKAARARLIHFLKNSTLEIKESVYQL